MEQNFIENELIILTKQTYDAFLKSDNPAELIALYSFYYYTAKWQKTNQPKCTTGYTANGLKWSESKIRKFKKELIDLGLIEDIALRDEHNKIAGHYIKLNYILKQSTLKEIHTIENPQCGNSDGVEKKGTNALSDNNINALSTNNKNKNKKTEYDVLIENYTDNIELRSTIYEFIKMRKGIKKTITSYGLKKMLNKLDRLAANDDEKIQILDNSIERSWAGIFELSSKGSYDNKLPQSVNTGQGYYINYTIEG